MRRRRSINPHPNVDPNRARRTGSRWRRPSCCPPSAARHPTAPPPPSFPSRWSPSVGSPGPGWT
jgi:hypothetical protein